MSDIVFFFTLIRYSWHIRVKTYMYNISNSILYYVYTIVQTVLVHVIAQVA